MNKRFLNISNKLLSALLVAMGFASCDDIGNSMDMYGTPIVDYHVIGQVTDRAGNPLTGIRVTARGYQDITNAETSQVIYTDKEGRFETANIRSGWIDPDLRVVFEDVDGEDNGGQFEKDSIVVDNMLRNQLKRNSGWFNGEYELKANIRLDKSGQE